MVLLANLYALLLEEGIEGIKIEAKDKRIYPNNNLVSHILGGTDIDGKGIAGIEKSFNEKLLNGEDLTISIHNGIQYITEKIMSEQIKKFDAEGGAGIVMNAKNGEITSTYNNDNPYLVNYFVDEKVIFKNLKNNSLLAFSKLFFFDAS